MPYIPPEVVEQARQIDLLTYLQSCEPQELVRISGNNYTTRTHDSLKISNGKWMWWSQRIGGYNALDYLVKVKGCSFVEAVETLMGKAAVMPSMTVKPKQKTEPRILLLPDKSASTERITEYLFSRGIDYSIPLWAVTLIGGLFITVMSFILIMTVYGRFFRLYMYTALAPIPLSTFAGEPSQNVGKSFIKSYCAVCLEGAVIVLSCIIFSLFASSPPVVNPDAAAVTQVWSYVGELLFNMLILVGSVKMSDRIIREMMGL